MGGIEGSYYDLPPSSFTSSVYHHDLRSQQADQRFFVNYSFYDTIEKTKRKDKILNAQRIL